MSNPPISRRLQQSGRAGSPIRKIMELAAPQNIINLGLDPDEVISFAGGWVNHEAPEEMRNEYARIAGDSALFHASGAYSPTAGLPRLRELLVALDQEIYGSAGLQPANVIVGQSSTQLTFCLFMALLERGDRVVLFDPAYANYVPQLALCDDDLDVLSVPVLDTEEWTYFADSAAILANLEHVLRTQGPKLMLFSSPDNPTGGLVPDPAFFEILELAAAHDCFVAVDYAYRAQYFTPEQPTQFGASPVEHPNLIKIHSNSKWCRGLGRRLGWVEAHADVVDALETVQQSVVLCPDTVHQMALAAYLEHALQDGTLAAYMETSRQAYKAAAEHLSRCIEEYLQMQYLMPEGGLYSVVNVGRDSEQFVHEILENTGVVFVPGAGFGDTLAQAIRVSFGPLVHDLPRMEEGFARVRDHLANA